MRPERMLKGVARLAAIYTRISLDDGFQSSTARQERLCRAWVDERGWEIAGVYEDVDRSAYDTSVQRDAYERLLADVAAKRVDVVVCWRLDRLARSPGDFERFLSACQIAGVEIASATEPVDSTTPTGVALVRMLVTFAGLESDVRGLRLRARAREDADRGRQPNGGPPYGLAPGCTEIVESEAALIREAVERVLDGEGCTAIARSWAARGVVGRSGKPWSPDGLRGVLRGRAICGDRMHRGRLAAEGCWPAIIDPLTGAQVRLLLAARSGSNSRESRNHLLRGLLRCGVCGEKLIATTKQRTPFFNCRNGHVVVTRAPTEQWVTERVLARIEARHANRVRWRRQSTAAAIEVLGVKTAALVALNRSYWVLGEITHPEWLRTREELLVEARQELARAIPQPHLRGLPPRVPLWRAREVWDELSISARREVLAVELALVVVQRAPTYTTEWCSDRLELIWVRPDPAEAVVEPRRARRRPPERWTLSTGGTLMPSDVVPSADELRSRGGPLTISEASRLTNRSPSTINSARRRGRLESEFVQGVWRYRIEALDQWQSTKRHRKGQPPAPEVLLTGHEAALLLRVDEDGLASLVDAGTLVPAGNESGELAFSLGQIRGCRPPG